MWWEFNKVKRDGCSIFFDYYGDWADQIIGF